MEHPPTDADKVAFLDQAFQALSTLEIKRQEAIQIAKKLHQIEEGELKKIAEKVLIPLLRDSPYKAEQILTKAYEHSKVGGKIAAEYLWSHISVEDKEAIKAKALEGKNMMEDAAEQENVFVNHKVAEILRALHLG